MDKLVHSCDYGEPPGLLLKNYIVDKHFKNISDVGKEKVVCEKGARTLMFVTLILC